MKIGMLLGMLNNRLSALCNKYMEEIELTDSQSKVLAYLMHNDDKEVFQRDIEAALKLMNPTVTGILNRLERKGFVIREKSRLDGRYKKVGLTPKGWELRDKLMKKVAESSRYLFRGISDPELEAFGETLKVLLRNVSD